MFFMPSSFSMSGLIALPINFGACFACHYLVWCYTFGSCGYVWGLVDFVKGLLHYVYVIFVFSARFFEMLSTIPLDSPEAVQKVVLEVYNTTRDSLKGDPVLLNLTYYSSATWWEQFSGYINV